MAAKQVFISHISSETELAQGLQQRLGRDFLGMLDIFVSSDRHTIEAGSRWLDEVDRALNAADVQLVLCSRTSVDRPWVNFEAGAAWLRGIPVVPVCHSGLTVEELPVPLTLLEGVEGSAAGLQKLYDTIARVLAVNTPAIDFTEAAREFRLLEERQMQLAAAVDRVDNPRILCVASEQYAEPSFGFDLDVDVLRSAFGADRVTVESAVNRRRLTELLTWERFDIVHLVLAVEHESGALLFTPIELDTYRPAAGHVERLSSTGLAALLTESQTRLVVLATCKALLLAVDVAHVANMAAADDIISGEAAAEWSECFYGLLRQGKSVFRAMEITRTQTDVPIRGIRQRDVAFSFPQA
jgi:TIR domain